MGAHQLATSSKFSTMGKCKHINGDIWIQTDRPSYTAGELVEGTVFIVANEPIQCNGVQVKATGKEKVEWTEERTRQVDDGHNEDGSRRTRIEHYDVEFDEKEKFFKDWINVWTAPGAVIPPGSWSYRWSYKLPEGLPGSIDFESGHRGWLKKSKASIKYKFKATLDAAWKKDLKEEQEIVVHEANYESAQPVYDSKEEDIACCFCISKGRAGLKVNMDKNMYCPGETAQIVGNIDMSKSEAELTKMNVRFVRTISLKADGHFKQLQDTISAEDYLENSGIKPGETKDNVYMPINLSGGGIHPSTQGRYLKCEYHVCINCDISWASDVELNLHVTIVPPLPVLWQPPADMNFTPQA